MARDLRRMIGGAVTGLTARATVRAVDPGSIDEDAAESAAISQFLSGLAIVPEKSTRLVEVVYTSSDSQFAALAANTLAEEYAQQNLDLRLDTLHKNLAWLDTELAKQETKVREAEAAMSQYREQQNALSLEDRQNIVVSRLNQLNDTVTPRVRPGSRRSPSSTRSSASIRRRTTPTRSRSSAPTLASSMPRTG